MNAPARALRPIPSPVDPLTAAIREAVKAEIGAVLEALDDRLKEPPTALLTTDELARELRISGRTIARLRGEGLPTIWIGDSPRFELGPVIEWLRKRDAPAATLGGAA